ncbi:TadG family pilus assembly protein [Paraburkholderia sp. A1RI_3L]|uniref:TadG family pilus assembly protein n=1 Tax=Paraburkholderia TaxID=1822464 RepID=UPI003B7E4AEE
MLTGCIRRRVPSGVRRRAALRAPRRGPRKQRGSVAILGLAWMLVAVAALGAIDVGNVYFARRTLQRVADMAAIAGAQTVSGATGCAGATASAQANATQVNGLPSTGTVTVTCGRWDPSSNTLQPYFGTTGAPLNAVQVTVARQVPYFFVGPAREVQATAIAQSTNIGTFSLTTTLATLQGGLLNSLLGALLGTSLNLDVASYQALASAQIKLGDLAAAVGAASVSELLATQIQVRDLARAMVTALAASNVASASATSALGSLAASIPSGPSINIGSSAGAGNPLLAVGLADAQSAASATVNPLDMLLVAAEIANGQSTINLGAALNLGPLANVTAQARILEPPVIAVGEAGQDAAGNWRTTAHSAQVRLYLDVSLLNIDLGLVNLTALNLPVYLETGGTGNARLESTRCTASRATSQSTIGVQPGVLGVCVGGNAAANFTNYSQPSSCTQPAAVTTLTVGIPPAALSVTVNVGDPTNKTGLQLQLAPSTTGYTSLNFNGVAGDSDDYQSVNSNALGSAAGGLLTQLATQLPNSIYATLNGVNVTSVVGVVLAPLLDLLVKALAPVLDSLDVLLVPLLQLLGVQLGVATVHDSGLSCGEAQLVY